MSRDRQDRPGAGQAACLPTAAGFDEGFAALAASPGMRRVWQAVDPGRPPEIEPSSFVSADLLGHVARALALLPGQTPVDLGCGRGGPGPWLAQSQGVSLTGVDFSAVAVQQASDRAALFGLAERARFVVGDLAATGLAAAGADAVVSVDALHMAADLAAAGREVLRILRPGHRLVVTSWQPRTPEDSRLPGPHADRLGRGAALGRRCRGPGGVGGRVAGAVHPGLPGGARSRSWLTGVEFKLLLTASTPPPSLFAAPGRVRVGHRPGGGGAIATRYPLVYAALGVGLGRWSLRQG